MQVSEQDRREGIASELADIFYRQQAIIRCNELLGFNASKNSDMNFQAMSEEDEKTLRMIESVINSHGVRVEPKIAAVAMADMVLETLADDAVTPLEQLGLYTLLKQNQMLCSHLVHKSAQVSPADIKLAIGPFEGIYATFTKQVGQLVVMTETFGVEWITGDKPASGIAGRVRDAFATVAGAVMSKVAKPTEDMNVMTVLTVEHRKVDALFKEIEGASDLAKAQDLFKQLKADLTAHSIAEEDVVYNAFKRFDDSKDAMEDAQKEHEELREILDDATYLLADEEQFYEKVEELKDLVKHHVDEEEGKIFDLIKRHSTEDQQVAYSKAFLDAKREIQLNLGTDTAIASVQPTSSQQPGFDSGVSI